MRKITTVAALAAAAALSLSACAKHAPETENASDTISITDEPANGDVSTDGNVLDANGFDSEATPTGNSEDGSPYNVTGNGL